MLTHSRLTEVLDYDRETGRFTWKVKVSKRTMIGSEAGTLSKGYRLIRIDKIMYRAHRLAWLYVHGVWPTHLIDHKNRNGLDNRIDNLREATPLQNMHNAGAYSNNTSGYKGVAKRILETGRVRWLARTRIKGTLKVIGSFDTPEQASDAYIRFAKENHGSFYNHAK